MSGVFDVYASHLPPFPQSQDIHESRNSLVLWLNIVGDSYCFFSVYLGILPLFIKYYLSLSIVFVVGIGGGGGGVKVPRIFHTLCVDELWLT